MNQEPTGAAHAAGGIPALQGREDVNANAGAESPGRC